jgi:hypothetical protein
MLRLVQPGARIEGGHHARMRPIFSISRRSDRPSSDQVRSWHQAAFASRPRSVTSNAKAPSFPSFRSGPKSREQYQAFGTKILLASRTGNFELLQRAAVQPTNDFFVEGPCSFRPSAFGKLIFGAYCSPCTVFNRNRAWPTNCSAAVRSSAQVMAFMARTGLLADEETEAPIQAFRKMMSQSSKIFCAGKAAGTPMARAIRSKVDARGCRTD